MFKTKFQLMRLKQLIIHYFRAKIDGQRWIRENMAVLHNTYKKASMAYRYVTFNTKKFYLTFQSTITIFLILA